MKQVYFDGFEYLENFKELITNNDSSYIASLNKKMNKGKVLVFRNTYSEELISQIKNYLSNIGVSSLPNYVPIKDKCPNSHRINNWDERSYVKACFHQFQFLPWNDDMFDFYKIFRPIFHLMNFFNNTPKEKFLTKEPKDDCTARVAFQFYPAGIGEMNLHIDPYDSHQSVIATLVMSKKGSDFISGGLVTKDKKENMINLDDDLNLGDLIFFSPQIIHGVEKIDPDKELNWPSFRGRWMCLFAFNKLQNNKNISNSLDLK